MTPSQPSVQASLSPARTVPRDGRLLALFCVLGAALQIYAFHWGVITPDSVVQYGQALTGVYDDWHPPITACVWRQLLRLGSGGAPFLIMDVALYWAALGLVAHGLLRRHGRLAALTMLGLAFLPIAFGQVGAILKDPFMACVLLAATALLVRREWGGLGWLGLPATLLILLAGATRFNALFAALPLMLLAAPRHWIHRPVTCVATATAAAALLVGANWTLNEAMLRPGHSHPINSLVNFDLAGIVAHGGANGWPGLADPEARALVARCYTPRLYGMADEQLCARTEETIAVHVATRHESAIAVWLRAIAASPVAWMRHRLDHLNWNWRFLVPSVPDDAVYMMSAPNELGLHFLANPLTKIVGRAARIMAWTPLGRPATWLAIAIGLLIVAPGLPSRRILLALGGSALLYGLAYAVVSVAPDLRYNLWTLFAVMMGGAIAFAERAYTPGERWKLALLPAIVVMKLEVIALLVGAIG